MNLNKSIKIETIAKKILLAMVCKKKIIINQKNNKIYRRLNNTMRNTR